MAGQSSTPTVRQRNVLLVREVLPVRLSRQAQTDARHALDAQQNGCPDRADRGNLAKPIPGLVFFALRQRLPPHFLAQRSQRIQLLVVKLGPPAHSRFADLPEAGGPGVGAPFVFLVRCAFSGLGYHPYSK